MAREINLVPDIKEEMIKTLKLRNYIFFGCIVIAAASVIVTLIFGIIMGGQQLARDGKKTAIEDLSSKLNSYSDLNDTLTIKDQLGNLATLSDNKKMMTRTFNLLSAIIPQGADTIRISKLDIALDPTEEQLADTEEAVVTQPTLTIEAQANAGSEPYIDYNVLDSFKKSMDFMRYDYGTYVDKEDNPIPAYCIIEAGSNGATFKEDIDGRDNYYAYWTINGEGCNPSDKLTADDYELEDYGNQKVVRIWRTPQFSKWYSEEEKSNEPYMTLDGTIGNVPHFNSQCISYTGEAGSNGSTPKWTDSNDCHLIAGDSDEGGSSGIIIEESSNGRDTSGELVLRFIATITVAPEFYGFNNTHMLALAPSDLHNVTDSYVQIQAIFGQRATDCDKNDAACNNPANSGGNSNSSSSSNNKSNNSSSNTTNQAEDRVGF